MTCVNTYMTRVIYISSAHRHSPASTRFSVQKSSSNHMKDECTICKRVLSLYKLNRCTRCKKLYCRSCMTYNLWSEDRGLICLNCARRIVAPRHPISKYSPLGRYLRRKGYFTNLVTLNFPQIEGTISDNLPFSAFKKAGWWNNRDTSTQGWAWSRAGWNVEDVNIQERKVTFRKQTPLTPIKRARRRRRRATSGKAFTPVPVKPRLVRKPTKTKVAKVIARAKNLERKRMEDPLRLGHAHVKLNPKSRYQKRLWKSDARTTET